MKYNFQQKAMWCIAQCIAESFHQALNSKIPTFRDLFAESNLSPCGIIFTPRYGPFANANVPHAGLIPRGYAANIKDETMSESKSIAHFCKALLNICATKPFEKGGEDSFNRPSFPRPQ